MLRGCSSNFVERVLDAQDKSNPLFQQLDLERLLFAHDEMLKRRLTNYLIHEGPQPSKSEIDIGLKEFLYMQPPYPSTQPKMSASMQFALELLQARVTLKCTAERWPRNISELEVLMSVYRRLTHKSRSIDKTFLIKLGLQLVELRRDFKLSSDAGVLWTTIVALWKKHPSQYEDFLSHGIRLELCGSKTIIPEIAARWKEEPDQYEYLLVQCLRYGLGGSPEKISDGYLNTINGISTKLSPELRWRLLRLYCQHVPQKGIDIETSSDFKCLASQKWSFEVVDELERNRAVLFLDRLYNINPNFDFLRAPKGYNESIYSMCHVPRRNFNVELLLTAYRRDDADAQQRARDEVDRLRKKAVSSREQEDRALFAKASAHYAIATGDLDVYAETLLWQQRFIRDPLTVQSIFARDAILTSEGIALLSGISLPIEDMTLSIIRKRLVVANQTLKSLNEAKRIAMKEPSYDSSNWADLTFIYTHVYNERVSRVKKVKLQPHESELDIFHLIWEGTVHLVDNIGSDFLSQASGPIRDLLNGFSGPSLITTSETLLDFAAGWGKKEDRNNDQDEIADKMEQLAYQVVAKLAHSDTPILARDLIRRTIIEHPEASSWHRQFLSIGYMRDLPAEAAKSMLLSFATAIGEKLEEQSYVKVGDDELPKSAPPRSLIKVSTVKYLAQLLNDADFISPDSAVEVLIELFKSGTHMDVRLATLDSLLSTLNVILGDSGEQWRSNPMVEKILSTLDSVVSIAGNLNERRPVSEMDWEEAKEKVTIPVTSENSTIPPLFSVVLNITTGNQFPSLKKLQAELFSRLVLPTLHHSQEQHRRWFSLFLAKHRPAALDVDTLPYIPITPQIWHYMLNHQGHLLPSTTLNEYNQYVLLQLKMPTCIRDFNKALENDATLRNDTSVTHWLSIFGESEQSRSWHNGIYSLLNLIVSPVEKAAPMTDLIGAVVNQASVLLDDYEDRMEQWSYLVTGLGPARIGSAELSRRDSNHYDKDMEKAWVYWREATLNLSQNLIKLVEQKRTSSTDRDNVWPSTFPLRLWCLPYPDPRAIQRGDDFRSLAKALDRSLSLFLKGDEGNMLLWTTLVDNTYVTLSSVYTAITDRLCVAVHVGDLEQDPNQAAEAAVQLIKVSVALRFVDTVPKNGALRKPKLRKDLTSEKSKVGELLKQLRAVMDFWGRRGVPGGRAPFRDMVLQWKSANKTLWDDICSWDSSYEEEPHS